MDKNFFKKMMDGDFGLAKTFWLFGFVAGIAISVVTKPLIEVSIVAGMLFALVALVYQIMNMIGVWKAAGRYEGAKVWAVLAQIVIILNILIPVIGLIVLIVVLV
jgi:hypothetical protein